MHHVVVGASAAGLAAAEAIVAVDPGADVTLISEEAHPPYCRPLISYWLAGETSESLFCLPSDVYRGVAFRSGERVVAVDPGKKRVRLASQETVSYDRLCLATGASSKLLDVPGEESAANVFGFRTWDDALAIDAEIRGGARRAVVLGGGLVGVKAAHALAVRGLKTLLCITSDHPLSQVVDGPAGALVARALETEGVKVRFGFRPVAFQLTSGRVTGVRFDPPGGVEPCDLVVRGKGVDPRTELARPLGIDAEWGFPTDGTLRTPLPDVWAAGDAATTYDVAWQRRRVNAIWPMAAEQGTVAGRNMAGAGEPYPGSLAMNSIKVGPVFLVSAGVVRPPDSSYQTDDRADLERWRYRKIVTREGRIVGGVFAGPTGGRNGVDQAGLLVSAIRRGAALEELPFDPFEDRLHWGQFAFAAGRLGS